VTAIDMIGQLSFHSMELLSLVAGDRANMNLVHFSVSTSLRVLLNNVTWRLFLPKLREFSKINSHSYQKRETPELEGALVATPAMSRDASEVLECHLATRR